MEQDEILDQLKNIVELHAPHFSFPFSNNSSCWLDGDQCPYGFPNGRFQDRPVQICHLGKGGCNKLIGFAEESENFLSGYHDEKVEEKLNETIKENKVSLSSQLKIIAEEQCEDGSPEKQVLELAADIIREEHDQDILDVDHI